MYCTMDSVTPQRRRSSRRATPNTTPKRTVDVSDLENEGILHVPVKPEIALKPRFSARSPLTPMQSTMYNLRQKLEKQLQGQADSCDTEDKTSPGLARLRMTPGKPLKEKQQILMRKHQEARSKLDKLTIGGGISLWPEMDSMRMGRVETLRLCGASVGVFIVTIVLFKALHGSLQSKLTRYYTRLQQFSQNNAIHVTTSQTEFRASVLSWHTQYMSLVDELETSFAVSFIYTSVWYKLCVISYVVGVCVLLYYLADNMLAKNKLTPKRIKTWVLLLVVIATWTTLGAGLLSLAQNVERAVEKNVQNLTRQLGVLVNTDLDLTTYSHIMTYWRIRSLPPTTHGTLTIMGLLPVRDVTYYLQYYSLPVLTALLTPVVKLVIALKHVYSHPVYIKAS